MARNTIIRSLHDVGLAAWFGGTLANAVALNPAASATQPVRDTPPDVANAQQQLQVLQWAVPALTGALVVLSSLAGEQQQPS